ncbi:MAG TPA: prolipoprotein diacylglyceryl transferase, partial [Petrotogaceae bacterium]|nr:prolipoprotein diacylglyceryl transferase [Petrotogaceae bacterium]
MFKDRTFTWVLITTVCFFALISLIFLPKAFSGEVVYSPEVFSIGPLAVRWYGLLISSSILLCYFIGRRQAFKERVSEDDLLNAVFIGIILGVIGARLYYVIFNFSFFSDDPISILKIWTGGLAIHGGILGAVVSTFLYTRYKK